MVSMAADVDDDTAVDLPEQLRVELLPIWRREEVMRKEPLGVTTVVYLWSARNRRFPPPPPPAAPPVRHRQPLHVLRLRRRQLLEQLGDPVQVGRRFGRRERRRSTASRIRGTRSA